MSSSRNMKIITWNVKGLNAFDKRSRIKEILDNLKGDVILLQETKLLDNKYQDLVAKWINWKSIHVPSLGASRGLISSWNPRILSGNMVDQGLGWKCCNFEHFDISMTLLNVYGPNSGSKKLKL